MSLSKNPFEINHLVDIHQEFILASNWTLPKLALEWILGSIIEAMFGCWKVWKKMQVKENREKKYNERKRKGKQKK